ncbi:DUF6695 family protein [Winogradskyella alexanderae]|uniref:Uncharacterized protein n=1 Tax=Winogradskyella alexanderae TaxID=2877123 RepID=A0ABS7XQW4_9FLAO|nr:DUF6695 family protein [Winogradskyella alexanderae]MCA0132410.1 hypothetical protein [Winogradskyella alexanderae]
MSKNNAIILTLAYPETIVSHADEWYSKFLRFTFIGNRNHVRAGHAALVLVNKYTGILEYHDFGRYITSEPNGRVRGKQTDFELDFPLKAQLENNKIVNLEAILKFLATNPKLTHGDGHLYASVCNAVDYDRAREHIKMMQQKELIRYAAFVKDGCNCARFVTDTLIASVNSLKIKNRLIRSKWFTPSTIGNVVIAAAESKIYLLDSEGNFKNFESSISKENKRLFLDTLKGYKPSLVGTMLPQHNQNKAHHAQWLGGIAAGAWFEIYDLKIENHYRFRRISPYGNIDCDGVYEVDQLAFDINSHYQFVHYSNCKFFHIEQDDNLYKFHYLKNYAF